MSEFKLTAENYYSNEANQAYWSATFVKSMLDCPARTMAELNGEYEQPKSTALLLGQFVDTYFEGQDSFARFVANTPDIYKSRGSGFKAEYSKAVEMIESVQSDRLFMDYLSGQTQTIITGKIGGVWFKCKPDFYVPGERIVDLKTCKDFAPMYKAGEGKVSFADFWNWPLQLAIYQKIEGNNLPCYIAAITKESPPDHDIFEIPQSKLDAELAFLEEKIPYFDAIRQGVIEPERCGHCAYCRSTKRVNVPVVLDGLEDF